MTPVSRRLADRRFFAAGEPSAGGWSQLHTDPRAWERFYRQRWQHDKVVRSTHGVNCTGSCSWKIHVKDGLITWETQQTDYPTNGPEVPEYEPRGCPRGASFSWYVYSPLRVRHPYVRGALLEAWRAALAEHGDPVEAFAAVSAGPAEYKRQRGKGGFVRASWDEVADLVAAAHVDTIRRHGPDRIAGFSPIPAMSMASYAGGARFLTMIGGVCLSFYDWYADLPPASPQIWGDQTDVPESADWWNAAYIVMWGSNIPMTRTPDAHFMTEVRYKGTKTVVVSPDYSDHTKFADHWLAARPGTDAALAMAMGHVILREFYVDRQVPYFNDYARRFTDLPYLVALDEHPAGGHVAGRFLRASDLGDPGENAQWRTVILDADTEQPVVPNGAIGDRWGDEGEGHWNLEQDGVTPALSMLGHEEERVELLLPCFDPTAEGQVGGIVRRGVPARRVGGRLVTTVFDLLCAQHGVRRDELPGDWPEGYDDPRPYTPAWQEGITGVDAALVARIAREFARTAERTEGRAMIMMGAGTNHWFHSDLIYRAMLNLVLLCGCQGRNGGGWAHYVGQEKCRPVTGFSTIAFALDWQRPPRQQPATPFWYLATDQWRYERAAASEQLSPLASDDGAAPHPADANALAARLGWMPSYPTFDRNPLDLVAEAEAAGVAPAEHVVAELKAGRLSFACEDPDAPENHPRVLTVWRSNLLGSSSKGHEYFLKHLLGVPTHAVTETESPPELRPREVTWRETAPEGKLDLLVTLDFRMNGTCLYSDVVLPAATWYEKEDISTTDLHPFAHAFNAAINPPWDTKADWDIFSRIAQSFSRMAGEHLGVRRDLVAAPLLHDTPDEIAQPLGEVHDWRRGECEPVPGRTMPKLVVVERDYGAVHERMTALGPLVEEQGTTWKGVATRDVGPELGHLRDQNGITADGRPRLETARHACEAILALSGATNGRLAVEGFRVLERRTGQELADLAADRGEDLHTFGDVSIQPRKTITSPEWSGIESRERRYSPFCVNVERLVPWRTLTGRQQLYNDHSWLLDHGEGLPTYKPPLDMARHLGDIGEATVAVRYLTPHSKWSIHSTYQDNLHMLTLFRGGPVVWMSPEDAGRVGVADNDWIEMYNANGAVAARAVVSHRIPEGAALMYHAQDRHINVPRSEVSGHRGGTHNSVTRIQMKPTHMIGGYAQLSYGFNYYGPTGSQRDEVTVIRRRRTEVEY
ncbi:MAG: nitrate reductase subunit alpha [Solirubrobacteraceae bacterium]